MRVKRAVHDGASSLALGFRLSPCRNLVVRRWAIMTGRGTILQSTVCGAGKMIYLKSAVPEAPIPRAGRNSRYGIRFRSGILRGSAVQLIGRRAMMAAVGRRGLRPEMRIARRVVTLRMLEGMSRADLARAAQISESRASEIEQGIGRPSGKELFPARRCPGRGLRAAHRRRRHGRPRRITWSPPRRTPPRAPVIEKALSQLRRDVEFQDLVGNWRCVSPSVRRIRVMLKCHWIDDGGGWP